MSEVDIVHRLFTNAAAGGTSDQVGARIVPFEERDAAKALTRDVVEALDDMLRKATPAASETGWAVCRFAGLGRETLACVVASYPDLVQDAAGRPGLLAHARLVPVREPSFDAAALLETALEFPLGDVCAAERARRLAAYLDMVDAEPSVLVRTASVSELQAMPRGVLTDVLLSCLATLGKRKRAQIAIADAGPATLARAWAALPHALQQTSSWGVSVGESCPVDVIFSRSNGADASSAAKPVLVDVVERYVALLYDAPQTFTAMLANRALSDVNAFADAVQRAALAPQLTSIRTAGKGEMPKKEKGTSTRAEPRREADEWQPVEPDLLAEMNRQYEAMEKSLRLTMDERFAAWEARQQRAQSAPRGTTTGASAWPRVWLPIAVTVAVLAIGAGIWWYLRPPQTGVRTGTAAVDTREPEAPIAPEPEPAQPASSARNVVAAATASGKWADAFKNVLDNDPQLVVRAIEEASHDTTGTARAALDAFAASVAKKQDLGTRGRGLLRNYLVEHVAGDVAPGKVKVDSNVTDVAPLIADLKKRYGITSKVKDAADADLQSEIILRWMASTER